MADAEIHVIISYHIIIIDDNQDIIQHVTWLEYFLFQWWYNPTCSTDLGEFYDYVTWLDLCQESNPFLVNLCLFYPHSDNIYYYSCLIVWYVFFVEHSQNSTLINTNFVV